jgi:glutamine synthetase
MLKGFISKHDLWTGEQWRLAEEAAQFYTAENLNVLRLSFADQHGVLRGKALVTDDLMGSVKNGLSMPGSLLAKDTSHKTIYPVFSSNGGFDIPGMAGVADIVMVPDPSTFRVLPWANGTGWMQCDLFFPDGRPVPLCTRRKAKEAATALNQAGYEIMTGLEVELHLFRLEDSKLDPEHAGQPGEAPEVSLLNQGFQYLTEDRLDELEPILDILRRDLIALGLPLRSMENEFGPSQIELTFHPTKNIGAADDMVLLRSAVKQICKRHGIHATFMCRPKLPTVFSSGWHLHQSLLDLKTGENLFTSTDPDQVLSPTGLSYTAGLLKQARAASLFAAPTINGYKRYRAYSLAPDRAIWGADNKGTMVRAIGQTGDIATRIENRVGEPTANPYLYLASQIYAGLDGIERGLEPGAPATDPYETEATMLPTSMMEAVTALREDFFYHQKFSSTFVNYIIKIKEAEIARFLSEVTDWEQREYFQLF